MQLTLDQKQSKALMDQFQVHIAQLDISTEQLAAPHAGKDWVTTMAIGEEDSSTTAAIGEEDTQTSMAVGEEDH